MKIFVVSHKPFDFPCASYYIPMKVGVSEERIAQNFVTDKDGDSISEKNPFYCELTAAYWLWKNSTDDIVGLVHYRRYFKGSKKYKEKIKVHDSAVICREEIIDLLNEYDILVPKKRNYIISSIKRHYFNSHHEFDYNILRNEVFERHPDYIFDFDRIMHGTKINLYNMFVSKKSIIDKYFEWLFPILFSVENKIPYQTYDHYQQRVFGFMAERLFNVWLHHNSRDFKIKYLSVVNVEGEMIFSKGISFLKKMIF